MSSNYYDEPKKEKCLKCGEKFLSEGKHLRICPDCKSKRPKLGLTPQFRSFAKSSFRAPPAL